METYASALIEFFICISGFVGFLILLLATTLCANIGWRKASDGMMAFGVISGFGCFLSFSVFMYHIPSRDTLIILFT